MAKVTCPDCDRDDFRSVSGMASHRRAKHPPMVDGRVFDATREAVAAASHLTPMDRGTVEVLLDLARVIDGTGLRDPEAPLDNVTRPTYLKYAAELGLTPLARLRLGTTEGGAGGSKLAELRAVRGGRAS